MRCDSHFHFFSIECQNFTVNNLYFIVCCNFLHKYCYEWIKLFVGQNFTQYYICNSYPCILCASNGEDNTLLLYEIDLKNLLIEIFGYDSLQRIADFKHINSENSHSLVIQKINSVEFAKYKHII